MQRYFALKKENDFFTLRPDDYYHIYTVMRMNIHDEIEVVYDKTLYLACLLENHQVKAIKEVKQVKKDTIEKVLCIPLLTEQKFSFVLQKATELGIDRIVPLKTERSIVKLDNQKEGKKQERWYKICKEASEQSKRIDIPVIEQISNISDLSFDGLKLVCSTREKINTLKNILRNQKKVVQIVFVVGPEGGLTIQEEENLIAQGFIPVCLGETILRVETVPITVLSILNYEMME